MLLAIQLVCLMFAWLGGGVVVNMIHEQLPKMKDSHFRVTSLLAVLCIGGAIAYGAYSTHGSSYEDGDEMGRGGHWEQEFESTEKEKVNHGMFVFLFGTIPALIGAAKGLRDIRDDERQKAEDLQLRIEESDRRLTEAREAMLAEQRGETDASN